MIKPILYDRQLSPQNPPKRFWRLGVLPYPNARPKTLRGKACKPGEDFWCCRYPGSGIDRVKRGLIGAEVDERVIFSWAPPDQLFSKLSRISFSGRAGQEQIKK